FSRVVRTALFSQPPGAGRPGFHLAVAGCVLAAGSFSLLALGWLEFVPTLCLAIVILLSFGGVGTALQLERARDVHAREAVDGVRAVLGVLIVFALCTPFYSLFDQKATTW